MEETLGRYRAAIRNLDSALEAAERRSGDQGLVQSSPERRYVSYRARDPEVAKLLVHPEQRRQGIARALMLALEDAARTQGRELLTLDTRSDDHAEPLYLSLGYTVAGRIPGYALDAVQTARRDSTTLMYKTLPARPAKLGALHLQESC